MENLTVKEFVTHYLHPFSDIKIVKDSKVIFKGRKEIIFDSSESILNNIIKMVGANSGYIVLNVQQLKTRFYMEENDYD